MSYRPTQDVHSKRKSRTIDRFAGVHYGMSKEKQPGQFAALCDLDVDDDKLRLRPGKRKNETTGYEQNISSLFAIHIGGGDWVASIIDGVLQAVPAEDVLTGVAAYYTWDEVRQTWTVAGLRTAKTWHGLLTTHDD